MGVVGVFLVLLVHAGLLRECRAGEEMREQFLRDEREFQDFLAQQESKTLEESDGEAIRAWESARRESLERELRPTMTRPKYVDGGRGALIEFQEPQTFFLHHGGRIVDDGITQYGQGSSNHGKGVYASTVKEVTEQYRNPDLVELEVRVKTLFFCPSCNTPFLHHELPENDPRFVAAYQLGRDGADYGDINLAVVDKDGEGAICVVNSVYAKGGPRVIELVAHSKKAAMSAKDGDPEQVVFPQSTWELHLVKDDPELCPNGRPQERWTQEALDQSARVLRTQEKLRWYAREVAKARSTPPARAT